MPGTPCFIGGEIGACRGEVYSRLLCDSGEGAGLVHWGADPGIARPSGAPCGPTAERRFYADSWNDVYDLQLERARFEAGEALSTLRRLQRRVSELEEESRLQDAEVSGASLQTELAHSLDSDQDQDQHVNECEGAQVSFSLPAPYWLE